MVKSILILIFISVFVLPIYTQDIFVVKDPDGYVNIREKPNANSRILGRATFKDLLALPGCDFDSCDDLYIDIQNWQVVGLEIDKKLCLGYVYKDCIQDMDSLPELKYKKQGDNKITYSDDVFEITFTLKSVKECPSLKIEEEQQDSGHTVYNFLEEDKYASEFPILDFYNYVDISMQYKKKTLSFSPEYYLSDFFCQGNLLIDSRFGIPFVIKKGYNGLYYLFYHMGDGGESYSKYFTIDNTGVINIETVDCDNPVLVISK